MSTPTDTDQPSCKLDPEFSDFVLEHVHNEHGNFNQEAMRATLLAIEAIALWPGQNDRGGGS